MACSAGGSPIGISGIICTMNRADLFTAQVSISTRKHPSGCAGRFCTAGILNRVCHLRAPSEDVMKRRRMPTVCASKQQAGPEERRHA